MDREARDDVCSRDVRRMNIGLVYLWKTCRAQEMGMILFSAERQRRVVSETGSVSVARSKMMEDQGGRADDGGCKAAVRKVPTYLP